MRDNRLIKTINIQDPCCHGKLGKVLEIVNGYFKLLEKLYQTKSPNSANV